MRTFRTPARLAVAAGSVVAAGFLAAPANAAADCAITGAPTTVVVGLTTNTFDLTPTTNCPAGSSVEFRYNAVIPDNIPSTDLYRSFALITDLNGNPKALHNEEGKYPFGITSSGDVLAGRPMPALYTAYVDAGRPNLLDGEPTFSYSTTLTVLRATRTVGFTADKTSIAPGDRVTFTATTQRADWETKSWRAFDGALYDLQFRADGSSDWADTGTSLGSFYGLETSPAASGDYRLKYQGDVVSGVSYSKAVHIAVS